MDNHYLTVTAYLSQIPYYQTFGTPANARYAQGDEFANERRRKAMNEQDPFVIPLSLVGRPDNVSDKTVRRISQRLESAGEIVVQHTPTGRGLLNIPGYRRLREEILAGSRAA